ncbi:MAG: DUF882 domain-containing protein [Hydrogenophaga sp.]|uniref:YcbK family protein n=1 Tax=Hydrogenophaga sp. TaxID=1904254 RepID=UPI001D2B3136|nr:DUF882 domain-containing protein [Hydrogenophaga sp.]MBX3611909.1 DUF882 domain-containing protein [Hydrogenophaga sp.]
MKRHLHPTPSRRHFLRTGLSAVAAAPALALPQRAWAAPVRELAFDHLHTHEQIDIVYARGSDYLPDALGQLNHFLRDHYSGDVGRIDPGLHDLLHAVRRELGTERAFQVISGYRSPATNAQLKATRGGGVATHSLHMEGRAIDVRLPGVALSDLRDAALSLKAGGVGYYPHEQFVHIDTGRVRRWGG